MMPSTELCSAAQTPDSHVLWAALTCTAQHNQLQCQQLMQDGTGGRNAIRKEKDLQEGKTKKEIKILSNAKSKCKTTRGAFYKKTKQNLPVV